MDSPPKAKTRPSPAASRSSSRKFFRCFRSAVLDDGYEGGDHRCEQGADETFFAVVAAKENEGHALRKVPSGGKGDDGSDEDDRGKKKKKKKGLKSLARASKAVLFETSLAKKLRKKKSAENSLESISNLSMEADRILKLMHQNSSSGVSDNDKAPTTESDGSNSSGAVSPSLSSSRSSSMNSSMRGRSQSSTRSSSFNLKQIQSSALEDGKERPSHSENFTICLLLLTLTALILWGKVCAIVCTSTWLLLVPRWSTIKCAKSPFDIADESSSIMDSPEYKKKIILKGLLQRKQCCGAHLRVATTH